MSLGTVKFFNESKGYGFIKDNESGKEIFVHVSGLIDKIDANGELIEPTHGAGGGAAAAKMLGKIALNSNAWSGVFAGPVQTRSRFR